MRTLDEFNNLISQKANRLNEKVEQFQGGGGYNISPEEYEEMLNLDSSFIISKDMMDWSKQLYSLEINRVRAERKKENFHPNLQKALLKLRGMLPASKEIAEQAEKDYIREGLGFRISDDVEKQKKQLILLEINRIDKAWNNESLSPFLIKKLNELKKILPDGGKEELKKAADQYEARMAEKMRKEEEARRASEIRRQAEQEELNNTRQWFNSFNTYQNNVGQKNKTQRNYGQERSQNQTRSGQQKSRKQKRPLSHREISINNTLKHLNLANKQYSDSDLTKAYRSFAMENHPDRTSDLPEDEIKRREALFKEISEGYHFLKE